MICILSLNDALKQGKRDDDAYDDNSPKGNESDSTIYEQSN